ncbi:MAG: LysM peptidoglycan-binding domain-containing protein [Paludibacteraceae bacterium]|nr:LysM peptidoglycan-binding domain-containing protein [Paludibacteraceae bacterium]
MKKILLLFYCALCIVHCAFSQTDYPIVEKNGKSYYEYTINPGEGLFAIARKFGIKQNDLHEANENLSTNVKVGDKILIPIKTDVMNKVGEAVTTHIVEAKQTLYGISKMYNVNIDTLIALNPSAKTGIKVGETLIISKDKKITSTIIPQKSIKEKPNTTNNVTHVVQRKETLYAISKKYNIAIHDLIALNPELKDGLKAGSTIIIQGKPNSIKEVNTITTIKPTPEIETEPKQEQPKDTITINEIGKIDSIKNIDSTLLNIAYLLPLVAESPNEEKNIQRFIEFYRGSILALNEAKKEGLSANIYTYNLPKNPNKVDSVLNQLNNNNIDIVIGPAYSEQLNKVLTYTKENDITTIVPFSSKIDSAYYFSKLIQFNPPQDTLFRLILKNTFEHRNLQYILARFENCTNKGNTFANDLSTLLTDNNKEFKEIIIKPEHVDSLVNMISNDTTILVLGSSKINDVAGILDSLNHYQLPNLQIWGFEEWGINIIKKYPQTLYYSLFFPNETEQYKSNYKNWFGTRKQTVGVKYDLLGYDLTLLALKGIKNENSTLNIDTKNLHFLQSTPKLEFIDNRWLNMNYYLLFWNNITIKNIGNKE